MSKTKPLFVKLKTSILHSFEIRYLWVSLLINNQWCPVKLSRFLPSVEMTRCSEFFAWVGVGGGFAATNPYPPPVTVCHSGVRNRKLGEANLFKYFSSIQFLPDTNVVIRKNLNFTIY